MFRKNDAVLELEFSIVNKQILFFKNTGRGLIHLNLIILQQR